VSFLLHSRSFFVRFSSFFHIYYAIFRAPAPFQHEPPPYVQDRAAFRLSRDWRRQRRDRLGAARGGARGQGGAGGGGADRRDVCQRGMRAQEGKVFIGERAGKCGHFGTFFVGFEALLSDSELF
jgi:hypothetical protein